MRAASIVIRAKNEAKLIGTTLEAIFEQDERDFEVLVVDSGSTDGTLDIVKKFGIRCIEIRPDDFTFGRALNYGIRYAIGEFAISLSAHAVPTRKCWLSSILSAFDNPQVAGVYGRHIPMSNVSFLELMGMRLSGVMSKTRRVDTGGLTFSNANGAIRRSLWKRYPFNESLAGAEDIAWAGQIRSRGYSIAYEPDAAVYHSHGESFWRLMKRQIKDQPVIMKVRLGLVPAEEIKEQESDLARVS